MFNLKLQMQLSMIDNDCGRRWRHRRDRGRNGEWWSQHRKRRAKVGTNSNKLVRLTKYIRNTLQPSDNRPGGLPLPTSSRTACRACPGRAPSSPPRAPSGFSLARCLIRSSDVNLSTWVCISQILAEYSQNTPVPSTSPELPKPCYIPNRSYRMLFQSTEKYRGRIFWCDIFFTKYHKISQKYRKTSQVSQVLQVSRHEKSST